MSSNRNPTAQTEPAPAGSVQRLVMSPFSIEDLSESVERLARRLKHGCGNHGCRINPPKGMGTNVVCNCSPREIAKLLLDLAVITEEMGRDWRHNTQAEARGPTETKP